MNRQDAKKTIQSKPQGNLQKIMVSPTLFKEVFLPTAPPGGGAHAIRLLPGPWLAGLIVLLAGLLAWRRPR